MDRFELHVREDGSGNPEVEIRGSEEGALCGMALLLYSLERFTGIDRIALVAAVLAVLEDTPMECESATVEYGLVEDAYRRLKQRET